MIDCVILHQATRASSRNLAFDFLLLVCMTRNTIKTGLILTLTHKVKDGVYDERSGRVVLNEKVLDDYKCPRRERMIVMDEVGNP